MPPTARKATKAAAKPVQEPETLAPDPEEIPVPDEAQEPAEGVEGTDPVEDVIDPEPDAEELDDFCPTPGECFPYGIPEGTTAAGCVHGDWVFGE